MHMSMTFAENKTPDLWKSFMPRRNEIKKPVTSDLFSMQIYGPSFDFKNFNPTAVFEKWAAVEVPDFNAVPAGMDTFTLPGGQYAVFLHKGGPRTGPATFAHIFGIWLPSSIYAIDNRPHFEVLGESYKNDDPNSEEEIWIPVKLK